MDATLRFVFLLVATILFVIAAFVARAGLGWLVPAGLAFWVATACWDAAEVM